MNRPNSNGNVLFLILIAVALFAALSYAVTSSSRSGGGDISKEKKEMAFSAIQNHIAALRTGMQMMSHRGVNMEVINVYSNSISGSIPYSHNYTACTSDECRLYKPAGGNTSYFDFHRLYPQFSASAGAANVNGIFLSPWAYKGSVAPNNKMDYMLVLRVTEDFCKYYNERLGLGNTTGTATGPLGIFSIENVNNPGTLDSSVAPFNDGWGDSSTGSHMKLGTDGCVNHNNSGYKVISLIYAR